MVYCWRSFLILSQIILESYSQFPDVDLVESDIRVISEGYPQNNHGNRQQEPLKFRSKSLQYIYSEHVAASSARNVTIMVEDDPEDERQNIVEDTLRFPFGRIRDSSTSSGDLGDRSKFGDRNELDQDSGQTDSDVKIWYGDDATEGEFPFMARVKVFKSYRQSGYGAAYGMCGGSIISPRIVLTAAHCVVVSRETWHELESPVHYEIIVGDHSSRFNTNERAYKAEGVIIHPDYDNGATIANDIAMIILAEDIQFTDGVSMIKIPETSDAGLLDEGQTVTVAGWGGVETGGSASTLQKMEYLFSSRVWCKRYWYYRRMDINDGMICTDRVSLSGGRYAHIWSGDSGSALFSKSEDGTFTQLALVSWSSSLEQIDAPDVHTNVFYYRDWIRENMDLLESTYLQKSRAFYGTYQELEFTDFRHFLFRRTNLYSLSSNLVIEADVTLIDISINHFVMIYDGEDIEEDKMIAMLTRNEELTNIISSSNEGFTIVMQTNDRGDLGGSVKVRYRANLPPSGGSPAYNLKCPNGFWPCVDDHYCIRDSDVCDNVQGSSGQCKDASDEDEGCTDEGGDADSEGWISVISGRTDFSGWNSAEQSISLQSYSYKASWDKVELEISHKTAREPVRVEIKFGEVQLYIRVTNCTEYFFGLDYPSSFTSGGANEYVLSFNDNFMSILGNEEILWNFYYNGDLAMESCSKAIQGMSTTGKFAAEDTATEKYKLISKPGNDELDIEPDPTFIKDYSEFDSIPFSAILRDTNILYDLFKYPIQIVTRGTIDVNTGIVIDIFHEDSEVYQSFIEIFFYKSAPAYYLQKCMENVIFFPMPEPDKNGDRVWTIEIDKTEVVFRCNGREFGRVVAGTNTLQDCESLLDNNGKLNRIKFPSEYDAASDAYRVLCLDGCVSVDLWRPIGSYYVEFQWDIKEFSLQYMTEDGKGSELVNLIGFYESEEKFDEYRHVATYHGKTHFWVWIRNCTEYWIPLRYQTVFDEVGDSFSATFTFHKNYASVLSNGELMWNFYYDSDVAMDLCQETIGRYFSNAFFYYGNGNDPKSKDKLRLVGRPSNDSELITPEPEFKDFSQFDGQRFAELTSKNPIEYDLVNLPLQLKTEVDVPEFSNFSLSLLNAQNEEIGSITIGFWKFAAYFLILPCHEGAILMTIPEPLVGSKTRIWTVEPSESTIILRCNGYELGRVAKGSNLVLDTCDGIFGGTVSSISVKSPISVFYRLLCSDIFECAPCSAGNYMTETGCRQCGENTFSEDGASSCTKCPDGKISSVGSTSLNDCYFAPCSAGNYMTETGCKQCGENTFSEDGASSCTKCPDGKISSVGSTSLDDCYFAPCSAGNYMTETGCKQCGENTFSEDGASSCTKCPGGKVSSVGSTSLDDCYFAPCSAGNYMTETGCQQCGVNTFSEDGASSCTDCPERKIAAAGSISQNDCHFAPCSAGNYMTGTGCKQCGENTFSEDGASSCTKCPDGKISSVGSTSLDDCYFAPCSAGNYMTEAGCRQCGENTFSEDGASSCTKCPDGKISSVGSTSLDDCRITPCSAGNYMTETGCKLCGENTFSEDGASSCTKCPDGQISSVGSTSLDDCYEDNKVRYKFKTVPARYQSHLGLLMVSLEEEEDWRLVCGLGAGRNEADTVCRSMGYRTGLMIESYVREFYSITSRTSYQVSNMKCPERASSLSDCSFAPYEFSGVPCFRGEEVKVSCSNEPFQLTNTDFYVRIHRRGYTMFKCSAKALRFGNEVYLDDTAEAMALHRKYNGEMSVVLKKLYYKGKRSYWISRTKITPPSWSDRCFVCVIQIRDIGYLDVVLSDLCNVDKDQVLEEVKAYPLLS